MAHGKVLEPAGCTTADEKVFCEAKPPPPPPSPPGTTCESEMTKFCAVDKHKKAPCLACMDKYEALLERAGCTIANVDTFCEPAVAM
jgi:hypothetical protein